MFKLILGIYLIIQSVINFYIFFNEKKLEMIYILPIVFSIAVLAICESIEKSKIKE